MGGSSGLLGYQLFTMEAELLTAASNTALGVESIVSLIRI